LGPAYRRKVKISLMSKYVTRLRQGKKFIYYFKDGQEVKDKAEIDYFNSLAVPPAWRNVKIDRRRGARVLATGYDKAGRLQYIYNPKFRERMEREKFERILRFAKALPKMRRVTEEHLSDRGLHRQRVLACIVRLMDEAYFRVGNQQYAKENQSYGISTLRSKHITVEGDSVQFDFVGKSGQRQVKRLTDAKVAKIIKALDELPGYEVFKYYDEDGDLTKVTSADINAYIKEVMGEEFSAKDFRTWGGTLLATADLAAHMTAKSPREKKQAVSACVRRVARKLGNTPAIARGSYIDPRVIASFVETGDLSEVKETVKDVGRNSYLNQDERCVIKLLERVT
jgi:DNA topoisomerase-1